MPTAPPCECFHSLGKRPVLAFQFRQTLVPIVARIDIEHE
jgi:hypothetical protein